MNVYSSKFAHSCWNRSFLLYSLLNAFMNMSWTLDMDFDMLINCLLEKRSQNICSSKRLHMNIVNAARVFHFTLHFFFSSLHHFFCCWYISDRISHAYAIEIHIKYVWGYVHRAVRMPHTISQVYSKRKFVTQTQNTHWQYERRAAWRELALQQQQQ